MSDLRAVDTSGIFEVDIYDPETLLYTGIFFSVLGQDSEKFQKKKRAQEKKRLARISKGGFRGASLPSAEEVEQDNIELLAECVVAWGKRAGKDGTPAKNTINLYDVEMPCTLENVTAVFNGIKAPGEYNYIKEQIDKAMGDRANFIKA